MARPSRARRIRRDARQPPIYRRIVVVVLRRDERPRQKIRRSRRNALLERLQGQARSPTQALVFLRRVFLGVLSTRSAEPAEKWHGESLSCDAVPRPAVAGATVGGAGRGESG